MRSTSLAALTVCGLAATTSAQTTLLFTIDEIEVSVNSPVAALAAVGTIEDDEIALVTPVGGTSYAAAPFLSQSTQWAFLGDHDADGDVVESTSPGTDIDAIMINRLRPAPAVYTPHDVFISKLATGGFNAATVEDGDVFRYSGPGQIEWFVHEDTLLTAIGQVTTNDLDLDAICMDLSGNLFVSFADAELINGVSADDGAVIYIPATGITYDASFNVTAMTPGSAAIVLSEANTIAMILASGLRDDQNGVPATTAAAVELSALEIDANGGTFVSPQNAAVLPNLWFSWDNTDVNGAILSTAGGGSIAVVNGVAMGSTFATVGTQVGLRPTPTSMEGLIGLASIPAQAPQLGLENWPLNNYTVNLSPLYARQEVSGASPGGLVAIFLDFKVGGIFPALSIPGFGEQIYGTFAPLVVATMTANANGLAVNELTLPPGTIGSGLGVVWQALDFNTLTFAWPGATEF